jgi:hypothetical protein
MQVAVVFYQGVFGAALYTKAALRKAAVGLEHEFRIRADPFGIMAPPTAQGATFEEQSGPNPRAIVNGIVLDVEESA